MPKARLKQPLPEGYSQDPKFFEEETDILGEFLLECCLLGPQHGPIAHIELYGIFCDWLVKAQHRYPATPIEFPSERVFLRACISRGLRNALPEPPSRTATKFQGVAEGKPNLRFDLTNHYFASEDPFGRWFTDRCEMHSNEHTLPLRALYESWIDWCDLHCEIPRAYESFKVACRNRGLRLVRAGEPIYVEGIRFKEKSPQ